ncbi:hypothetical protein BT93_B0057 [Corymbia citriodora subsp. variegata]|nr:hypothetical protein BT93_B0057 [Corymbia citriodora subsp. variegata]
MSDYNRSTHPANELNRPDLNNPTDSQDPDSSVTHSGSIFPADQFGTALSPFIRSGLMPLSEGDEVYRRIKERFISQLGADKGQVTVVAIHQNSYSSFSAQARARTFQIYSQAVQEKGGGDTANVKYAWYEASKEDVPKIFSYGFGHSGKPDNSGLYGCGIYLAPDYNALEGVICAPVDEDGLQHLVLCRVILGKSELVCRGSEQFRPSSEQYDSGIDDLSHPKKYIVWSTHMNTHVLPEYVISFRTSRYLRELSSRTPERSQKPTSPWMPFPDLISELSKIFHPSDISLISKYYKDRRREKISRYMLVHKVRRIAGDKLLIKIIKSFRAKICRMDPSPSLLFGVPTYFGCNYKDVIVHESAMIYPKPSSNIGINTGL